MTMLRLRSALALTLAALVHALPSQSPVTGTLVQDLNTGAPYTTRDSMPQLLAAAPGRAWFAATTRAEGREVWTTDGTAAGTLLLGDLTAGPLSSTHAGALVLPNGRIVVMSTSTAFGAEPFVSDPASPGLQVLADLMPGTAGSAPSVPVLWFGEAWFAAETPAFGVELWRSDGTTAGTVLGGEILPGPASLPIDPYRIHVAGNQLFVVVGGLPAQLMVKANPSATAAILATFSLSFRTERWYAVEVAGQLMFPLDSPGAGIEPWITDGTSAGTRLLADLSPGIASTEIEVLAADGQRVWFRARTPATGNELWITDGTTAGTRLVIDLNPGPSGSLYSFSPGALLPNGDLLYTAWDPSGAGTEPWRSDGTAAGTRLVADLVPGLEGSNPTAFRRFGAAVYFRAGSAANGRELWRYDLSAGAPVLVTDIAAGAADSDATPLADLGSGILLAAREARHGQEPWMTNGTAGSERLLADIHADPNAGSQPGDFARHRDLLVFTAIDDVHGGEPWVTDGTAAGTRQLADLEPGPLSSAPKMLGSLPNGLLFGARRSPGPVTELWSTDGTPAGTRLVSALGAPGNTARPQHAHRIGDRIVFVFPDLRTVDLWTSDGTTSGTAPVTGWTGLERISLFASAGGRAYGSARGGNGDIELFITDGTAAGTQIVDLWPGSGSSSPLRFAAVGDGVVFTPYEPVDGIELWFAGGHPLRVQRITDIGAGADGTQVREIASLGDVAVFTGWDPLTSRYQLWRTDGTTAGTVQIQANLPIDLAASARRLTAAGGHAFFWGQPAFGAAFELWITDGTAAGTRQVTVSQTPGFGFSHPFLYKVGDGTHVAFAHYHPGYGRELWISDGTAAGSRVLTDTAPLLEDSNPVFVTRIADRIVFAADDGATGEELHAVELREIGAWVASPFGSGCGAEIGASGRPVLGAAFSIDVDTAAGAPVAFLFSRDPAWSPLGAGCALHLVSPFTLAATAADAVGAAHLAVTVPTTPALVGDLLHFQAFAVVAGGPLFGVIAGTPGLEVVIGR